jgi:hypothetical protein
MPDAGAAVLSKAGAGELAGSKRRETKGKFIMRLIRRLAPA